MTVTNKPAHRGEHEVSRKAIAQGMSDCLRCPVCSCAPFLRTLAHETAGAARTRHSLRPLFKRRKRICKTSGETRRENTFCRLGSLTIESETAGVASPTGSSPVQRPLAAGHHHAEPPPEQQPCDNQQAPDGHEKERQNSGVL